jgi:hypothetical protein
LGYIERKDVSLLLTTNVRHDVCLFNHGRDSFSRFD